MSLKRPILAMTMGDPAGVGPEVILKAAANPQVRAAARCLAVGDAAWFRQTARRLGLPTEVRAISAVAAARFAEGVLDVFDLANVSPAAVSPGCLSAEAGRAGVEAVQVAANLALRGQVDALVTAPINKEAMHLAGYGYPGHTEMLVEFTGTVEYCALFVTPRLRVFIVTACMSLRKALDLITKERVHRTIRVARRTMQRFGISEPRLAVAGLNPHAGQGGLFGDEELHAIAPAIAEAQAAGIDATGPWPADTVFARALAGHYDAVIAMYYDQGQIPAKLLGYQEGVTVTAGLPIIRTSVDHGTAYDIADQGVADERSMVRAILLASRLASGSMMIAQN